MNPEIVPNSVPSSRPERGRAAIPVEQALAFQVALIEYMVGPRFAHFSDSEKEDVITKWFDTYVTKELPDGRTFNAFAEYCDEHADDVDFISRVREGKWTISDLEALKQYAEESPKGDRFMPVH